MMKEYDDDDSDVYQQHSFYRRSSVSEVNCSLKSFCEYEDQGDSVRQIANILHDVMDAVSKKDHVDSPFY
ncbi:hypothetical protein T12_14001 [Trichinella patagoniensis]|uniref:Uncharacterized protein n=1 Tax=Trichinella patagoniensis TaxID=990121 RepID=A0A0V0Z7R5_9BILA|nr:hypothetical protein T12_14001 [Trichinella patagoniensis]